jgi:cystathionine beta-lyase/cystathionine gamma-synthase
MTEHTEQLLKKSLDSIDGLRRRWIVTVIITAALSQAAWLAFAFNAERAEIRTVILLATLALAMCVFGGVFLLVLHVTRMTHRILQAIELTARQ